MSSFAERQNINTLPNELIRHIFSFLDVAPPSASTAQLLDEPHFNLTCLTQTPLKSSSCVSKLWREIAVPFLFRHAQIAFLEGGEPVQTLKIIGAMKSFLTFLITHDFNRHIESLTVIAREGSITGLPSFVNGLFWQLVCQFMDPDVLTIVASPQALGALTGCGISMEDAWTFNIPCQYLRFEKPAVANKTGSYSTLDDLPRMLSLFADQCCYNLSNHGVNRQDLNMLHATQMRNTRQGTTGLHVMDMRPWTKVLLNEGSFIRGYATYEWWQRDPPSILRFMLQLDASPIHNEDSCIRDFSYIAIFPMHAHFSALTEDFPLLHNLYVQLVPRNEILQNKVTMAQVEAEDLWMERNSCYALLMRQLFQTGPISTNFQALKVFESGDAADEAAWNMAVEYVKRAGNGWEVQGDGVIVRNPEFLKETTDMEDEDEDEIVMPLLSVP